MLPTLPNKPFSLLARCLALVAGVAALAGPALAQDRIYRCGNEYTNNATTAKARGCKLMEGGNVTVVQGGLPAPARAGNAPNNSATTVARNAPRNDSVEQRARDSDARQILEAELRKAEERLEQAQRAYANGQPEKEGTESRNHQRYLDRVAELKAGLNRAETDVNGLKRELGRMGGGASPASGGSNAPAAGESAAK